MPKNRLGKLSKCRCSEDNSELKFEVKFSPVRQALWIYHWIIDSSEEFYVKNTCSLFSLCLVPYANLLISWKRFFSNPVTCVKVEQTCALASTRAHIKSLHRNTRALKLVPLRVVIITGTEASSFVIQALKSVTALNGLLEDTPIHCIAERPTFSPLQQNHRARAWLGIGPPFKVSADSFAQPAVSIWWTTRKC